MAPVIPSDLVLYEPSLIASTDDDEVGGGVSGTLEKVDGIVDEIFFTSASKPVGQGATVRYSKAFARNDNATEILSDTRVYLGIREHPGQIEIALEHSLGIAILDGDQILASPLTAPAATSFSTPLNYAAGLTVGNSGWLTAQSAQGIWLKQSISEGIAADASAVVQIVFGNS